MRGQPDSAFTSLSTVSGQCLLGTDTICLHGNSTMADQSVSSDVLIPLVRLQPSAAGLLRGMMFDSYCSEDSLLGQYTTFAEGATVTKDSCRNRGIKEIKPCASGRGPAPIY